MVDIFPIGAGATRYFGNLDVPDGGYVGNVDGVPIIIFDYGNDALQLGGTNILGAGSITADNLTLTGLADTHIPYSVDGVLTGDDALTWDDGAAKALTIGNCAVLGSDSAVYQPNADSTTFFQIKKANGTVFSTWDTTNCRLKIGPGIPINLLHLDGGTNTRITMDATADIEFQMQLNIANPRAKWGWDNSKSILKFNHGSSFGAVGHLVIASGPKFGLNEEDPETFLELTHATPYLTLHNSTHEDSDGGRESRLNFKGEQSGGEETTLVGQEVGHDGAADDQKGYWDLFINFGSDGDAPTKVVRVDSSSASMKVTEKSALTSIGGVAVKLTNTTGAATVQGQTVKADPATDDAVILTAADDTECIGVFLDAGIADDAEAWVVVAGIADVAMGDNEAATHGNWVETNSAEAGYADATSASPAAAPQHFNEIGHCIESVAAGGGGTHILARCVLHFL